MPSNSFRSSGASGTARRSSAARSSGVRAAGSRSPKHRGYRPETDEAPKKRRWSADEKAARQGSRPHGAPGARWSDAPRDERDRGDRSDRAPRSDRGDSSDRGDRTDRTGRYERVDRGDRTGRSYRPDHGDRARQTDRPYRGDRGDRFDRSERFDRSDRSSRPDRSGRPDRAGRDERPRREDARDFGRRQFGQRTDDRAPREDGARREGAPRRTGGHDFVPHERSTRSFDSDRTPRRDREDRFARTDRDDRAPRRDRDDRASRDDRARRRDREDRFARTDRDDRAPRRDRDDRAPRADRSERTERSSRPDFTPRNDRAPRRDYAPRGERASRDYNPRNDYAPRTERAPRTDSDFYPDRRQEPVDDVVLDRLEASAIEAADVADVTFDQLGLGGNITRTLAELGATTPFPIQAATIPDVLAGRDVLGRGRTGSGKTIAFAAPLVERLMLGGGGTRRAMGRKPRALILAPTRELALQIDRTVQPIARSVGLFTTQIYGGVPQARQVGALNRGVDIIIGTPGRIEDLVAQGRLDLSEVSVTVLDEADHMCDLGFLEPVQRILNLTAEGGQRLLFSATLDSGVATLVEEFLSDPAVYEVAGEDQASSTIDHHVLLIEHRDKPEIIRELVDRDGKTLVFVRTRAFAEMVADQLEDAGIPAVSLHGDLNQSRRTRNLEKLTSGRVDVLVATDVAARGIHVDDIDLVIQADAPEEYKTYLHRAGRTGRAGKVGTVVTLVPNSRRRKLDELLGRAEIEAAWQKVSPGDELLHTIVS